MSLAGRARTCGARGDTGIEKAIAAAALRNLSKWAMYETTIRPSAPNRTAIPGCTAAKRRDDLLRPLGGTVISMPRLTIMPDESDLCLDTLPAVIGELVG